MRLLTAMTFCLLIFLFGCSEQESVKQQRQAPEVDVSTPIEAVITQWDEYTGRFGAVDEVELRARVSGYLQKVNFKDGQTVKKGDVLFVIDQRPFEIALRSAESRFTLAKKELERGNDLRKKNSISQEEVDRRLNEYEMARAALDNAKLEMEFTEVKSPIDGIVSRDLVNVGNLVNGSANNATLLTTVVSINPIHFYFDAGEGDLLKYMRLSQMDKRQSSRTAPNPVKIRLQDEDTFAHEGVMDFVDNRVDQSTGTIQGRAILDNQDGFILPGLFGRIRLLARENVSVLLVPDTIIGTDQSRKFVYIVNAENQVDRKFVKLGKLHNQELRVIESGLLATDKIIVNGLMRVRPGAQVQPVDVNISEQYDVK
ncbi:efflux RND transporter periplasmic adaptor subunit [Aliiglaciecola litoralis]|uniref:Efflux RND transporter periplasmic adaptor subunit n=1 Tax=Aliiglaciecola litoralis TaxID=582857 RepID=A0ABP3WT67_9ALTE